MAATQCVYACTHGQDDLLKFKPSIRMRRKSDLSDLIHGMLVDARQAGLSVSETAVYWDFYTQPENGLKKQHLPSLLH